MIDYNNKVVLVTGAASGIGAALVQAFTARGAQVVCADINADGLQQTVVATGNKAKAITCDLADPNVAEQLIDDVYAEMGRLDLVCSNAGIGFAGKLATTDFSDQRIEKLFEINLFAGLKLGARIVVLVIWSAIGCRCCECVTWCGKGAEGVCCAQGVRHTTSLCCAFAALSEPRGSDALAA